MKLLAARWPARPRARDDAGSAIVEAMFLGVLLLIPLTYALLTAFEVQRSAYSMTAAARDAGRVVVAAPSWTEATADARTAVSVALEGAGIDAEGVGLTFSCSVEPCLTAGAVITVRLSSTVPLPWLPPFVHGETALRVSTDHRVVVDEYRGQRS